MSNPNDTTNAATPSTNAAPQKRRGRPVDPNSGLAKARAMLFTLPTDSARKDVVAAFQTIKSADGTAMSKDTAAAYYSVLNRPAKSA